MWQSSASGRPSGNANVHVCVHARVCVESGVHCYEPVRMCVHVCMCMCLHACVHMHVCKVFTAVDLHTWASQSHPGQAQEHLGGWRTGHRLPSLPRCRPLMRRALVQRELRTGSSHRGERRAGGGDKALGVCTGHLQASLEATLFHYSFPESCEVFMKTLILLRRGVSPQGAKDSPKPCSAYPKLGLSAPKLLGGLSKRSHTSACGGDEELPVCRPAREQTF